jgi:hypothetical protein
MYDYVLATQKSRNIQPAGPETQPSTKNSNVALMTCSLSTLSCQYEALDCSKKAVRVRWRGSRSRVGVGVRGRGTVVDRTGVQGEENCDFRAQKSLGNCE